MSRLQDLERTFGKHSNTKNKLPFVEWVLNNIRVRDNLLWKPFSFKNHEYLKGIYEDDHPSLVIMKAAQLGLSHWAIAKLLWVCDSYDVNAGYFFPTNDKVKGFVQSRVDPIIDQSPLAERVGNIKTEERSRRKNPDNTQIKKLDNSIMTFRGLETLKEVKSIDLDFYAVDEVDEANQKHLEFVKDRTLHSSLGYQIYFSQATVPDFGIDELYKNSDQRQYLIKCDACGHWNNLIDSFPDCIMMSPDNMPYRGCSKCRKPLDVSTGEWVIQYNDRDTHGYQVSQLFASFTKDIYLYNLINDLKSIRKRERIENSIIGRPFAGDKQPWSDTLFKSCESSHGFYRPEKSVMGIDTGSDLHIVIAEPVLEGENRFLNICKLIEVPARDAEQLLSIALEWNVQWALIDAGPERALSKKFVKLLQKENRKAAIQEFSDTDFKQVEREEGLEKLSVIKAPREDSLDQTVDLAKMGQIRFPNPNRLSSADLLLYETFKRHHRKLIKEWVINAKGIKELKYKRGVENHFGMAMNSMVIAAKLLAQFDRYQPFSYRASKEKRWSLSGLKGLFK